MGSQAAIASYWPLAIPPLESLLLPRSRSIALTTHCPTIMAPGKRHFSTALQQELAGILCRIHISAWVDSVAMGVRESVI